MGKRAGFEVMGWQEGDMKGRTEGFPCALPGRDAIQVTLLWMRLYVRMCVRMCVGGSAEQMCFTSLLTSQRAALIEGGSISLWWDVPIHTHARTHQHTN